MPRRRSPEDLTSSELDAVHGAVDLCRLQADRLYQRDRAAREARQKANAERSVLGRLLGGGGFWHVVADHEEAGLRGQIEAVVDACGTPPRPLKSR